MKDYKKIFKFVEDTAKIPFKVMGENREIYVSEGFNIKNTFNKISIEVFGKEVTIIVNSKDQSALPLLGTFITESIREDAEKESCIIKSIIDNLDYSKNEMERLYPFLCKDFILITINMNNSIKESINLIKDGYENENVCILSYGNNILILGNLDEPEEHAESLKETLEYNLKERCIVCYFTVKGYTNLSSAVQKSIEKIALVKKYSLQNEIVNEKSLVFEAIVDSISKEKSEELIADYENGFNKLDEEMIKSIEVFLECGLNVSESAKLLYIHRNTLLYRIEKLEKYTGFDIKDFNQAIVFKVLYTLWKKKVLK